MMEHCQIKLKCLSCGLHFIVCSWRNDWPGEDRTVPAYCPECGKPTGLPLAATWVKSPIFMVVPGVPK